MEIEKIPDVGKIKFNKTFLGIDDSIILVNVKLKAVVKNFVEIGVILNAIAIEKMYLEKDCIDIIDFAFKEFGLSKNQAYNLMSVAKKFTSYDGSYVFLKEAYTDFTFSQLVEMVSIPSQVVEEIDPSMTIKEIREIKKQLKALALKEQKEESKIIEVEFKEESKEPKEPKEPKKEINFNSFDLETFTPEQRKEAKLNAIGDAGFLDFKMGYKSMEKDLLQANEEIKFLKDKIEGGLSNAQKSVLSLILKDSISEYLNARLEVLRGLAKDQKKSKSDDYYLYLGGFNEVKFLIDELKKDFRIDEE